MIQEFYEHLKEVHPDVAALYEVKPTFMHWAQIALIGVSIQEMVLNVSQTQERKVYDHARFLVQELVTWAAKPIRVTAQGMASQALILLTQVPGIKVTEEQPAGTLYGRKRNLAKTFIVELVS